MHAYFSSCTSGLVSHVDPAILIASNERYTSEAAGAWMPSFRALRRRHNTA